MSSWPNSRFLWGGGKDHIFLQAKLSPPSLTVIEQGSQPAATAPGALTRGSSSRFTTLGSCRAAVSATSCPPTSPLCGSLSLPAGVCKINPANYCGKCIFKKNRLMFFRWGPLQAAATVLLFTFPRLDPSVKNRAALSGKNLELKHPKPRSFSEGAKIFFCNFACLPCLNLTNSTSNE